MPDSVHIESAMAVKIAEEITKQKNVTTNLPVKKKRKNQYLAAFLANLSSFAYGAYLGWPSPALVQLQSENPPVGDQPITNDETSWIGSLVFLGFLCGTPIYNYLNDKIGRKLSGLLISVPIIVSWLMIIFGDNINLIFGARFMAGISMGGVLLIVPIYVGEVADVSIRGSLGTYLAIFCNGGILFAYIVGSYTTYTTFAIICLTLPVLFIVTFIWMPETPVYLLKKGDIKKAEQSLKWLRGDGPHVDEELTKQSILLKEINETSASGGLIKSVLCDKGSRKALIIGVVVTVTQVLSGVFVVLSYNATIFKMAGSDIPEDIASIITGGIIFVGPILSSLFVDKAGRKILLIGSLLVMTVCLSLLGIYFYFYYNGTDMSSLGFIPIVCLGIYVFCLGIGIGPVNMILLGELFLPHVRSLSASVCTFSMGLSSFLITRFYNNMSDVIGIYGSFWVFAGCCLLGAMFAIFCIPETNNRTVESIHAELSGEKSGILPSKKQYKMNGAMDQPSSTITTVR